MKLKLLLMAGCGLLCVVAAITIIALWPKPSAAEQAATGRASLEAAQRDFSATQYKPAEIEARRAVKLFGQLVRKVPKQKNYPVQLGHSQWQLGDILSATDRPDEAERILDEALRVFQKATVNFPDDPFMRQEHACSLCKLGSLMDSEGKFDAAAGRFRLAATEYAALKQQFPKNPWWVYEEGYATYNAAKTLDHAGRLDEAEAEFQQAIGLHEKGTLDFPNEPDMKARLMAIRGDFANLLRKEGKSADAEAIAK